MLGPLLPGFVHVAFAGLWHVAYWEIVVAVLVEADTSNSDCTDVLAKLSDGPGTIAEASGAEEDATLEVIEGVLVALPFVPDAGSSAGVEVEETNGGAFSMYELSACTAYSPTSRSPLGVS
jgi:hypothetical protein